MDMEPRGRGVRGRGVRGRERGREGVAEAASLGRAGAGRRRAHAPQVARPDGEAAPLLPADERALPAAVGGGHRLVGDAHDAHDLAVGRIAVVIVRIIIIIITFL